MGHVSSYQSVCTVSEQCLFLYLDFSLSNISLHSDMMSNRLEIRLCVDPVTFKVAESVLND